MNSSPTIDVEAEAPDPVRIKLAGADIDVFQGNIKGRLHAIPLDLWKAIVGFHRAISIKYKAESMSYHKWSDKDQQYHSLIPFQKTRYGALSVDTDWADPRNVKLLDNYALLHGEDFFPACTIHTHVDIAAFESGTDAKDEEDQPGWHITLGNLITHKQIDVSCRIRLPKLKKISSLVDTTSSYDIGINNVFDPELPISAIVGECGTLDWESRLPRVEIHSYVAPSQTKYHHAYGSQVTQAQWDY